MDQLALFPKPEPAASILYEREYPPLYIRRIQAAIELVPGLEIYRCAYVIASFPHGRFVMGEWERVEGRGITAGIDLYGRCLIHEINPKYVSGKKIDDKNQLYLGTFSLEPEDLIAFEKHTHAGTEFVPITEDQKAPWRDFIANGDHLGYPGVDEAWPLQTCITSGHRFNHRGRYACLCPCHRKKGKQ